MASDWPKVGSKVRHRTTRKTGEVKNLYLMQGKLRVLFDDEPDSEVLYRGEVQAI